MIRYLGRLADNEKRKIAAGLLAPQPVRGARKHGGIRSTTLLTVVAESGLYKLVMRSDKPQARQFQDWVTRDVLPAIRKERAWGRPPRLATCGGVLIQLRQENPPCQFAFWLPL